MRGTLRICFGEKPSRNTMQVVPMSNNSAARLSNWKFLRKLTPLCSYESDPRRAAKLTPAA